MPPLHPPFLVKGEGGRGVYLSIPPPPLNGILFKYLIKCKIYERLQAGSKGASSQASGGKSGSKGASCQELGGKSGSKGASSQESGGKSGSKGASSQESGGKYAGLSKNMRQMKFLSTGKAISMFFLSF